MTNYVKVAVATACLASVMTLILAVSILISRVEKLGHDITLTRDLIVLDDVCSELSIEHPSCIGCKLTTVRGYGDYHES